MQANNKQNRMTQENNRKGKERDGIGVWGEPKGVCVSPIYLASHGEIAGEERRRDEGMILHSRPN